MESDEELVARVRGGKLPGAQWAFGQLYIRHARDLVAGLRRFPPSGLSHEEAEDVAADAWLNAWQQREQIDLSRGSFRTWLFAIAWNRARDLQKSAYRKRRRGLEVLEEVFASGERELALPDRQEGERDPGLDRDELTFIRDQIGEEERQVLDLRLQ